MRILNRKAAVSADWTSMPMLARCLMTGAAHGESPEIVAKHLNAGERVERIIKQAVEAGSMYGWGASLTPDIAVAQNGFVDSLRQASVFFELLAEGYIRKIPLRTRVVMVTAGATGYVRGEGHARPISSLQLEASNGLNPKDASAIVIASKELMALSVPGTQALFTRELRAAVGAVVDTEFMEIVAANKAATASSVGTTFNAAREDLRKMFDAISTDGNSRLVWVAGTGTAKAATTLAENGTWTFPEMTPEGGVMLGLPAYVSDQIAADSLYLIDADKITGNIDEIGFQVFQHASVQLETAPDSPATASTVMINLWQENLAALVARADFGIDPLNQTSVAELTDIAWGAFGVDSPT